MFTIDASVHINAYNPAETGFEISRSFLEGVTRLSRTVYSPTLLYVEVASSVARALNNSERGIIVAQQILHLPGQIWVPLDNQLAEIAGTIGAERKVRGSDAVYAAVAQQKNTTLVTLDQQQITRLSSFLTVCQPAEALEMLG